MGWFVKQSRIDLGVTFSEAFAGTGGIPTTLIASTGTTFEPQGNDLTIGDRDALVGFIFGFFNDSPCLGTHYDGFTAYMSDPAPTRAELEDLLATTAIDYIFWDSTTQIPAGTRAVGEVITDCSGGNALAVYDPDGDGSHPLADQFNDGLSKILEDGTLAAMCDFWHEATGIDPECIEPEPQE